MSEFLDIEIKEDSPEKLAFIDEYDIPSKYVVTAEEINLIVAAIKFLKDNDTFEQGNYDLEGFKNESLNPFVRANSITTVFYKSISSAVTAPTLSELNAFGTDRVDYPNLDRIYFKNGAKWTYIETTDM